MTNWYEEKQERRRERLEARAGRVREEANARYNSARSRAEMIPFGQPILVGHHSEKRDRNFRNKIHNDFGKAFAGMKEADELERRAGSVGTGGISSDDPEAVTKLQAELASLQERQAAMKAQNESWRKAGNKAGRQADGTWIDPPAPSYRLSNNSANIRRIEARIDMLRAAAKREHQEVDVGNTGIKLVQNVGINRIQIIFPGKPEQSVRELLKQYGFRWSPTEGAWQRHLNNAGVAAAKYVSERLTTVA